MLKGTDLTKSHDGAPLFDGVSLTLDDGARAALVGVNGVGKTTLIKLLAGVERPDRGAVAVGAGDRVGYLPQDVLDPGATIDDLLRRALGEVWEVRLRLDALERDLTDLDAYGEAQARFEALGGWALEARLDEARRRLGIEHLDRGTPPGPRLRRRGRPLPARLRPAGRPHRAAARRADQPPRRRRPRLARRVAGRLHRHAADGLARPRVPRRHRRPRARALRRRHRRLRGRLHRVQGGARAPPRAARAAGRGAGQAPPPARRRHRDDRAPGAVRRAQGGRDGRGRAALQAPGGEGGQEGQGARAPAGARDGLRGLGADAARPGGVQGAPARGRERPRGSWPPCATSPSTASSRTPRSRCTAATASRWSGPTAPARARSCTC